MIGRARRQSSRRLSSGPPPPPRSPQVSPHAYDRERHSSATTRSPLPSLEFTDWQKVPVDGVHNYNRRPGKSRRKGWANPLKEELFSGTKPINTGLASRDQFLFFRSALLTASRFPVPSCLADSSLFSPLAPTERCTVVTHAANSVPSRSLFPTYSPPSTKFHCFNKIAPNCSSAGT